MIENTSEVLHWGDQALGDRRHVLQRYAASIEKRRVDREHVTFARIAELSGMRPAALIRDFERAGVRGLTPKHVLQADQIQAFLAYFHRSNKTQAQEIYKAPAEASPQILVVQSINYKVIEQLAKDPRGLHQLAPRSFEELVAKILEDQGCEVTLTKRTRDGGYDVLGRMKNGFSEILFLAECKRYGPENKVGVEVVRGLYGVTEIQKANLGIVITTSSFTNDAREEKVRIGPRIDLKEYSDLCKWLAPYSRQD